MQCVTRVVAGLALATIANGALGQLNDVSQSRGVGAVVGEGPGPGGTDPGYSGSETAVGFAPFNRSVGGGNTVAGASASQNSVLDPLMIFAYCAASAGGMNGYLASSSSSMNVTFTIESETQYHFHGDYNIYDGGQARLYNTVSGEDLFNTAHLFDSVGTVNQIGVFSAGTYTLSVHYSADNNAGITLPSGYGTLTLAIPAPATTGLLLTGCCASLRRRRPGA